MASLLNSLNVGYSGLNVSQVAINTTSHNISNAETDGYTRQRIVTTSATSVDMGNGQIGNGADIQNISRIFDNFVFDRYRDVSADKEYSSYKRDTLEELSTYFPEIDGVGIKSDLADYYDAWQNFADNPDNDSVKIDLAEQTKTLTKHIQETESKIHDLQMEVNDQLEVNVNQVNDLAKQLADVNRSIDTAEAGGGYIASDLRDKRNVLEKNLSNLIGSDVMQGEFNADIGTAGEANIRSGSYTLSVNGYNIVDGSTFHPLKVSKEDSASGFYEISYERQDGVLIPLEENINGGKIGAILDLRGGTIDKSTDTPSDGIIQTTLSNLNSFSKGLIEATNNLYAQSSTQKMESNSLNIEDDTPLVSSGYNIKEGSFDVVVYDIDGEEVARRTINIDNATSLSGVAGSNSIEGQIDENKDDNDDNNATNDIDDFINFNFQTAANGEKIVEFELDSDAKSNGYEFSIEDNLTDDDFASGTNFAGALGIGRFLDGDSAKNIDLKFEFKENPTKIHAGSSSADGDNEVALDMVQQQFENYDFKVGNKEYNSTIYGMYDMGVTYVGSTTNSAISKDETISTQFNAIEMEYFSVSKVSIDEEMTNLIKYQTSYSAAAKVITTVDQMMQTLLGIKQ